MHTAKLPFHNLVISVASLLRLTVDYKQQLFPHRPFARRGLSRSRKLGVPEPLGATGTCVARLISRRHTQTTARRLLPHRCCLSRGHPRGEPTCAARMSYTIFLRDDQWRRARKPN